MNRHFSLLKRGGLGLLLALVLLTTPSHAQSLLIKNGQKVVFFGDDMTQGGNAPSGQVKLVVSGLGMLGVNITPTFAGAEGRSADMLNRVDHDAISLKPDWVVFGSGFSDAWNHAVDLASYEKNVTAILDKLKAANLNVMILTPPALEPPENDVNPELAQMTAFLVQAGKDRNLPLANLNDTFLSYLKAQPPGAGSPLLTSDNVNPTASGRELLARTILQAMGATPDQLTKVEAAWLDAPGSAQVTGNCNFCVRHTTLGFADYEKLKKIAASRNMAVFDLINMLYLESISEGLQAHGGDFTDTNPDDMSNKVDPIFTAKVMELLK